MSPTNNILGRHGDVGNVLRTSAPPRIVLRLVCELQPHPAYVKLCLKDCDAVLAHRLAEDSLTEQPVLVTEENYIVGGYERWHQATLAGCEQVQCLEYKLDPEQALLFLIACHKKSGFLNDFCRIRLALELEPWLRRESLVNQQRGGGRNSLSNLTEVERVDVRVKLAHIAGVSTGNITKVKRLLQDADPSILAAVQIGEISIHKAWCWSQLPLKEQKERLHNFDGRARLRTTIRKLVARHKNETLERRALDLIAAGVAELKADVAPGPLSDLLNNLGRALELLLELPVESAT